MAARICREKTCLLPRPDEIEKGERGTDRESESKGDNTAGRSFLFYPPPTTLVESQMYLRCLCARGCPSFLGKITFRRPPGRCASSTIFFFTYWYRCRFFSAFFVCSPRIDLGTIRLWGWSRGRWLNLSIYNTDRKSAPRLFYNVSLYWNAEYTGLIRQSQNCIRIYSTSAYSVHRRLRTINIDFITNDQYSYLTI